MKCYPEVLQVIHAAEERFYGVLAPNAERIAELETPCGHMDKLAERFGAEYVDCEIDEFTGAMTLSTEIPDIILRHSDGTLSGFFGLIDASNGFRFSKKKGEIIELTVVFDGLWTEV